VNIQTEAQSSDIDGLLKDWTFQPSSASVSYRLWRFRLQTTKRRPRPPFQCLVEVTARPLWFVYFVYLPTGVLAPRHHFTLSRLRAQGFPVFVVCASPSTKDVPAELSEKCEALYWKGLGGYDFSAYRLAMEVISARSCGARSVFLNDSVMGPFSNLNDLVDRARWNFTGFTATALNENHIQSYGFMFDAVTPRVLSSLEGVMYRDYAFDDVDAVILCQETRLARVASESMSVGAFWFAAGTSVDDAMLRRPLELLDAQFPFVKFSLFGKMRKFQDPEVVAKRISKLGHPV
jgi:hypothetical protein